MQEPQSPNDNGTPDAPIMDEQLARYARDLQQLYQGKNRAERNAGEAQQQAELRSHEVAALNKFLQGRLGEMFQMEAEYETLIDSLSGIVDTVQPPILQRTIQTWIDHGRDVLEKMRNSRV